MKLCRFQPLEFSANEVGRFEHTTHPRPRCGIIEGDTLWEILGDLSGARERIGTFRRLESVKLLPPAEPSKIVCVGKNYVDHAAEMGGPPPQEPILFLKPPSSITAPEDPVVLPALSHRVDYEGEIAVVIGRRCRQLRSNEDVTPYILGYTCFNDVTARDLQKLDGQWTRGKSFDTFCPFGPVLQTTAPSADARVETFVNGMKKQSARLAEMIFPVDVIIRFITQVMTLEPGDLVATGTPAGIGPVVAGDVMEVSVTGIGTLRNPVIDSSDSLED
jgi:2-keto-4-pentenoate hydratase/2-oxohepta-3-ene-1,7-dioic acid hydratase in catechol pathway